jgi:hypothetical protein
MSTNNDKNDADIPSNRRERYYTSITSKIAPPKEPRTDAHFEKSGDVGDSGEDTFRLAANRGDIVVHLIPDNKY